MAQMYDHVMVDLQTVMDQKLCRSILMVNEMNSKNHPEIEARWPHSRAMPSEDADKWQTSLRKHAHAIYSDFSLL